MEDEGVRKGMKLGRKGRKGGGGGQERKGC